MNLLTETIEDLKNRNLTSDDVVWIGSKDGNYATSWWQFTLLANKEYDNGYGGSEVIDDLVVVGDDWWMERHEYDGSEWWEFKQPPIVRGGKPFNSVFKTCYESTIAEMVEGNYGQRN